MYIHSGRGSGKDVAAKVFHILQQLQQTGRYTIDQLYGIYQELITQPIRKKGPHCGAKQRKKYGTTGRYNFAEPTFKNKLYAAFNKV